MSAQKLLTIPHKTPLLRQHFYINTTNTRATNVEMTLKTTDDALDNHR